MAGLSQNSLDKLCQVVGAAAIAGGAALTGTTLAVGVLEALLGGAAFVTLLSRDRSRECQNILKRLRKKTASEYKQWISAEFGNAGPARADLDAALAAIDAVIPKIVPSPADLIEHGMDRGRIVAMLLARASTADPVFEEDSENRFAVRLFCAIVGGTYDALREDPEFSQKLLGYFIEASLKNDRLLKDGIAEISDKVATKDDLRAALEEFKAHLASDARALVAPSVPMQALDELLGSLLTSRDAEKQSAVKLAMKDVKKGAEALEAVARKAADEAGVFNKAASSRSTSAAESYREAGALWLYRSVARAIAAFEAAAALDPVDFWTDVLLNRLYQWSGRTDDAFRLAASLLGKAGGDDRNRSVACDEFGDVLRARNDLEGALKHYREGLDIRRQLMASDPSHAERARDVFNSLLRIGLCLEQVNNSAACAHFTEAERIIRPLAEQARDHHVLQQDLAWIEARISEAGCR